MIGTTLSHYRIIEKLGQGGMGEVWKAKDTKLNRERAAHRLCLSVLVLLALGCGPSDASSVQDETYSNSASFGPTSEFALMTRSQASALATMASLAKIEAALARGDRGVRSGNLDAALLGYGVAQLRVTSSLGGLSYAPVTRALFQLHILGKGHPEYPFTAASAHTAYRFLGRQLLLEKLLGVVDEFDDFFIDDTGKSASVIHRYLTTIQELIAHDALLVVERRGLVVLGTNHIRFIARALLDYGMILSDGRWSMLNPSDLPGAFASWRMEDRGVLEKRAFRLDGTRSFVPGLRSLLPEDMWRLVDADPEHLLGSAAPARSMANRAAALRRLERI